MGIHALSDEQLAALQQALEEGVSGLAKSFPMSLAAVAVRGKEDQVYVVAGEVAEHLTGLVEERPPVVQAALDWVEVNRRVLVLTVGPRLRMSDLYQPLIELGLESGMVAPIMPEDELLGVLVIGSRHVGGYAAGEVEMVQELADSLAAHLRPAGPTKPTIAEVEDRLREVARALVTGMKDKKETSPETPVSVTPASQEDTSVETPQADPKRFTLRADELGRIQNWDERAEELFGWSADEVIGRFLTLLVQDKSDNVMDIRLRERLLAGGSFTGRTITWRRDGMPVVCELSLSKVPDSPEGVMGFVGHIEAVPSGTLLPHEPIELGFARLYDFSNRLS